MGFQKGQLGHGRRRTIEQVKKDAQAAEFYRQGMTFQQIADKMQVKSRATAFNMVKRAIADAQKDALVGKDAFSMILERVQDHRRRLQDVMDDPPPLVDKTGHIVTVTDPETGNEVIVPDKAQVVRVITELRHHIELEARLLDLYPASKQRVEVVTEDVVDREIAKLAKEMADLQGAAQPSPKP